MTTLLYTHPACLEHDPGPYHPESPARLRAVLEALDAPEFAGLERREAPEAAIEDLVRVHPRGFVERLLAAVPASGHRGIDAATILSPASGHAALRAAGAVVAAVDAVVAGEADNAFCAVRPPGHHAEPGRAMGFCLFNNVAIGALRAREVHGLARVAAIDFDVHHGNGTQARFAEDPSLFYASTHQFPLYPGTGRGRRDRGRQHRQRAVAPAVGIKRVPPRHDAHDIAGARCVPSRNGADLGRLRRAPQRSAGAIAAGRGRLYLGHRAAPGSRPPACRRARRSDAGGRLRSDGAGSEHGGASARADVGMSIML
jgi:hypothetical protein